jgi:predicted alpha-1,6-mannanase (GH76 family)
MAERFDDYGASEDTDIASQDEGLFKGVLYEILAKIANPLFMTRFPYTRRDRTHPFLLF